jgi:hypothetical protein
MSIQQEIATLVSNEDHPIDTKKIEEGLDFILSHFNDQEFLFPRKISTFNSNNKQYLTRSRQEIIDSFIDSDLVDCRINAYPYLTEYKGIQRYKPDFLFIDLDKNNFKSDGKFEFALYNTLKNIKNKLNGYPTVLFTGGGYHVYQPVYIPTALEYITEFSKFDRPSELFLRFAKDYLSNGKADKKNNPSFRSCLLRIPGSINSKYNKPVKINQKWNGIRPNITREFIEDFRTYLIQKQIEENNRMQKLLSNRNKNVKVDNRHYEWIEYLLQTPIEDFRKLVVDLILSPYLINIKKLSYEDSYTYIKNWLDKCNDLKRLDNYRNFDYRISYALKNALKKQIPPMSFITLKENYKDLYFLILQNKNKDKEVDNNNG